MLNSNDNNHRFNYHPASTASFSATTTNIRRCWLCLRTSTISSSNAASF
jgi:hypothetical protein